MKPSRLTEEQIIGILREQEAGAATPRCPPDANGAPRRHAEDRGRVLPIRISVAFLNDTAACRMLDDRDLLRVQRELDRGRPVVVPADGTGLARPALRRTLHRSVHQRMVQGASMTFDAVRCFAHISTKIMAVSAMLTAMIPMSQSSWRLMRSS
jgi:hypothetical protein